MPIQDVVIPVPAQTFLHADLTDATANDHASTAGQAAMEAETGGNRLLDPSRVRFHPGVAKVVCRWTAAGALVAGSFNTASITDGGTGKVTPVFDDDFSADTYVPATSGGRSDANKRTEPSWSAEAVGSLVIEMTAFDGSLIEDEEGGVTIFGDQ